MEKKRSIFLTPFKPAFIAAFVFFFSTINAQKMKTFKDHCGSFYESMAHLYKLKQAELDFYHFKPGQTIASIGAQCCHIEAAYAATTDSVIFYLEDIDSAKYNNEQAEFAWKSYATLRGKPMTCEHNMILSDEKSTSLPEKTFDKILIINSFHEFTFVTEMLADIKRNSSQVAFFMLMKHCPKNQDNFMEFAIILCKRMKKPLPCLQKMVLNI